MAGALADGTLREVLAARRRQCFVGRHGERELVRAALDAPSSPFSVLWFTGPGGIGKTSLLEAIAEQAGAAGVTSIVRLDGRDLPSSPRAALAVVREALGVQPGEQPLAAASRLFGDVLDPGPYRQVGESSHAAAAIVVVLAAAVVCATLACRCETWWLSTRSRRPLRHYGVRRPQSHEC